MLTKIDLFHGAISLILEGGRRAGTWEARLLRDHRSQLETIPHVTEDRATLNFNHFPDAPIRLFPFKVTLTRIQLHSGGATTFAR